MKPKSKAPFLFLAVFAVLMLIAFSVFLAEELWIFAIVTVIFFIATFGVGFTLKKKYRESNWL